jgi:hypothetical protein
MYEDLQGFCFHQLLVCPIRNKEDLHKGVDQAINDSDILYLPTLSPKIPPPPPRRIFKQTKKKNSWYIEKKF